jgi:hypothetical protein
MIGRIACVIACFAAVAAAGAAQRYRLTDERTLEYTLRFAGAGERTMTIRNINGTIRVGGSAQPTVQVAVRRTIRADSEANLQRAEQEVVVATTDQRPEVSAVVTDPFDPACGESGRRSWEGRRPYDVRFDFAVSVPANTRLVLCTVNGEAIEISGTSGDFDLSNVNGRINIDNVRGSGNATTVNGPITARLLDRPRRDGAFTTVNGGITVTWPGELAADLRLKTFNGGLFTDFDVVPLPSPPPSSTRREGHLVIRPNEFAHVRVGAGGPQLTLETLNGDVRVLRAAPQERIP